MSEKAFLVDTTKCSGCRGCQVACKQWNNLPAEKTRFFAGPEYTNPGELSAITWNHVKFFNVDRSNPEKPVWTIMHKKCYHCEDANCLKVCPQRAIYRDGGWIIIDQSKCIGCGACENECVYKVAHVSDKDFKSHKCHGCALNPREVPACAFVCTTGALTFGHRQSILKKAEDRLAAVRKDFPNASIYGKNEFGGLGVITILKDRPEKFGLPVNPKPIEQGRAEAVREMYSVLSLFTMGLPSFKRAAYKISRSIVTKSIKTS